MDVRDHNRTAWDREVERGNPWTVPVAPEIIARAREGHWSILLTESTPAPRTWFPATLAGLDVLCLASGGGQQGPVLAAAGARVTVLDNSPRQLEQDRLVAAREGLDLRAVEGDMRDLGAFADRSFDVVVHPVSNCFVPDVNPVWAESFRVLRAGGSLLAGFVNPIEFTFDPALADEGVLTVRYAVPWSSLTSVTPEEHARLFGAECPLEFGHSLDDQLGGQLRAGFVITGFYEDRRRAPSPIAALIPSYIATRATKPPEIAVP